ncbi:hypothetical protein V8E51_012802 [Hyaloscypha variabilis]
MSSNDESPNTMRAWTHTKAGHPSSVLSLSPNFPTPTLSSSPNSVRVRISHAALQIGGSIMMQLCPFLFRSSPAIPENDFSGTIVETGTEVPSSGRDLSPGMPVFGSVLVGPHLSTGAGALAEYVVVDANSIVRKPEKAGFEEAAGLAVSRCTALALMDKAGLKRGDSVLINGASGNVGHLTLQMAREAVGESGRIIAICSGRKAEMVRNLGADEYSNPRFDVIIDACGIQDLYTHCAGYLAPGKPFVSVGVAFKSYTYSSIMYSLFQMKIMNLLLPRFLGGGAAPYIAISGFVTLEGLERLAAMVNAEKLKVAVDSCWDMEDAVKAYEVILSKRAHGKAVVEVHARDG